MDDRQRQIQVGAGLQESRLNTELIGFLQKYGTWILMALLAVVVTYSGLKWYGRFQRDNLDKAFEQYQAARGTLGPDGVLLGSPDGLEAVAREQAGNATVATLAKMDAAEIYLGCVRRGLRPGTDIKAIKPEDSLSSEESAELLKKAESLFGEAKRATDGREALGVINLRARFGLASVSMSRGDVESARTILTELETRARELKLDEMAELAKERMFTLGDIAKPVALRNESELAPLPVANTPEQLDVAADSGEMEAVRMPEGFVPPGVDPETLPGGRLYPKPAEVPPSEGGQMVPVPVEPAPTEPAQPK
jgi:hypothetical protein